MPEVPEKKGGKNIFILSNYVKMIAFVFLALLIVIGNYFLESALFEEEVVVHDGISQIAYNIDNEFKDYGLMRFDLSDDLGLVPSMELKSKGDDNEYIFRFDSGRFWGNFSVSNAKVNILMDKVVMIPDHASFDLTFDGEKISLAVYEGDVYLGFLDQELELFEYLDEYSGVFLNTLLVPQDSQVTVPISKINSKLKLLLYSKLVKEFRYGAISSAMREDEWVRENLVKDSKYLESLKLSFVSDLIRSGLKVDKNFLSAFAFWSEENLTLVPDKKEAIVYRHLFEYLDDAIFYASDGEAELAAQSIADFDAYLSSLPPDFVSTEKYIDSYDEYVDKLVVFDSNDAQYLILDELLAKKFQSGRDKYEVVDLYWLKVYSALSISDNLAEQALVDYYHYLDLTLGEYTDREQYLRYMSYQNQLFDNLLQRYAVFYKDPYFAIKFTLENELIDLYEDGQLKDELKQAFISNKISFLKRLRRYFFDGEIELGEAKKIFSRLIAEIDDLMPAEDKELAVIDLFETQLEDVGNFWGYLNSPEYSSVEAYGATHEERYEVYLEEQDRIWNFINIQQDVLGEGFQLELSESDVIAEIQLVLEAEPNVSSIEVGDIEDLDQRFVGVTGIVGAYSFEAVYDRYYESLKDVYSDGVLISERPVKVGSLLNLVQLELGAEFFVSETGDDSFDQETHAERIARNYLAEQIRSFGFLVENEDLVLVSKDLSIYRVSDTYLEGYQKVIVTFDYAVSDQEKLRNIFLNVDGRPVLMGGEYSLSELRDLIIAEEDFSTYGQEQIPPKDEEEEEVEEESEEDLEET